MPVAVLVSVSVSVSSELDPSSLLLSSSFPFLSFPFLPMPNPSPSVSSVSLSLNKTPADQAEDQQVTCSSLSAPLRLDALPPSVLSLILSHIPSNTLISSTQTVCRSFYSATFSPVCWTHSHLRYKYPGIGMRFVNDYTVNHILCRPGANYQQTRTLSVVKDYTVESSPLRAFQHGKIGSIYPIHCRMLSNYYTELRELFVYDNLPCRFEEFQRVETLHIHSSTKWELTEVEFIALSHMPSLRSLYFHNAGWDRAETDKFDKLQASKTLEFISFYKISNLVDQNIAGLAGIAGLKRVQIEQCEPCTKIAINMLKEMRPQLEIIHDVV